MTEKSSREGERPGITIAITPEPTDLETAAIVAVVTALAASGQRDTDAPKLIEDRWQVAGRLDAMRSTEWPPRPLDGSG